MFQTIDLTHPLTSQTPIYPSDPPFVSTPHTTHAHDGYSVHCLSFGTHTGTHLDAPLHFYENGENVGQLALERLVGGFVIVDLEDLKLKERERIDWEVLERRIPVDQKGETILLIHTSWPTDIHFSHPYLSPSIAKHLLDRGISVIGIDTPSPDETPRADGSTEGADGFGFHEQFLEKGGIIIENLANLGRLVKATKDGNEKWIVSLAPLKLDGLDGSPIRAFAICMPKEM